jgi:hypothetical protein
LHVMLCAMLWVTLYVVLYLMLYVVGQRVLMVIFKSRRVSLAEVRLASEHAKWGWPASRA